MFKGAATVAHPLGARLGQKGPVPWLWLAAVSALLVAGIWAVWSRFARPPAPNSRRPFVVWRSEVGLEEDQVPETTAYDDTWDVPAREL